MIKVVIYDDNKNRRDSLKALIELSEELQFVNYYENCSEIVENTIIDKPDIVLMDIEMPGADGIFGVRILHEHFPHVKVIMQTVHEDTEKIFQCLQFGAKGYILKSARIMEIIQSIKTVNEGGAFMTPLIALKVMNYFQCLQNKINPLEQLTNKEQEVLLHLADGLSYKMIAAKMDIATGTVNNHLKRVYEKLQVHSAGEAISYFYKNKK